MIIILIVVKGNVLDVKKLKTWFVSRDIISIHTETDNHRFPESDPEAEDASAVHDFTAKILVSQGNDTIITETPNTRTSRRNEPYIKISTKFCFPISDLYKPQPLNPIQSSKP